MSDSGRRMANRPMSVLMMPTTRLVSLRRLKNKRAPSATRDTPTTMPPRAVHRHFIFVTGAAGAAVESLAMPVPEDAVMPGIVPPCASQFVNCGAMARTRPAITSTAASTFI